MIQQSTLQKNDVTCPPEWVPFKSRDFHQRRIRETIGAWRDQPSVADLQQLAKKNAQMPKQAATNSPVAKPMVLPSKPSKRQVLHLPGIQTNLKFPMSQELARSVYPDVTHNLQIYARYITGEVKKYKMGDRDFILRFWPGAVWDIKGQLGIPGAGHEGYSEWALYRGQLVHNAYLANNVFGQAAAARGMPLEETLDKTDGYYQIFHSWQHDQPEDRAAIISGWWEYHTGNPWPAGLKTPSEYWKLRKIYPRTYHQVQDNFKEQPEVQVILEKSWEII